jgi:hypothetical protein
MSVVSGDVTDGTGKKKPPEGGFFWTRSDEAPGQAFGIKPDRRSDRLAQHGDGDINGHVGVQ